MTHESPHSSELPPAVEKEAEKLLYELNKRFLGYDVSVGIREGLEPATGHIDTVNKKVEVRATPQDIVKVLEALAVAAQNPEVQEKLKAAYGRAKAAITETIAKFRIRKADSAEPKGSPEAAAIQEIIDALGEGETE